MAKSLNYPHILAELGRQHWAITNEALNGLATAVTTGLNVEDYQTFHAASREDFAALAGYLGERVPETRLSRIVGKVGSLTINGPIVPRASVIVEASGLVSIERLVSEFQALEADTAIETILLVIDSPGGSVTGVSEFAGLIAASQKRVVAYVYGMAASAAYWIASAASEIYSADTGIAGSIGVVSTVRVDSDTNTVVITNSASPKKRLDPSSKEGREEAVKLLDQLADVFISTVAENRNVSKAKVISDFGQGGVMGAVRAAAVGMVDGVESLRVLMSELSAQADAKSVPDSIDMGNKDTHTVTHMCTTKSQEKINMPSLTDLVAEHPNLRVELEAMKRAARDEGAAQEAARYEKMLAVAKPVLESDTYPTMKAMALQVLVGDEDPAALRGAVSAIDAMRAGQEASAAVTDSAELEVTPAAKSDAEQKSDDGILRSRVDVDAEIAKLQEELR